MGMLFSSEHLMRSKAHINTHPVHPMLVIFPIAFFTGALAFDLSGFLSGNRQHFVFGGYLVLAGITGAVLAAVPGIIDAIYTVPPQSSARDRVVKHGLMNSGVLVLFVIAVFLREEMVSLTILFIEAVAVGLMWASGWLGATLVHRNHIGVYNRYANSGKWNEQYVKETKGPVKVAVPGELENDQMKLLHIGNRRIVIARTGDQYVAFEDRCSHKGGSLAGGTLVCGIVQCPWHGTQFDTKTGMVKAGPGKLPVKTFRTSDENGKIYLHL
jgi:uncharacterized membrane protein/nitrite reductase/ring-hydroxylating ferredoxin subunit